MRIPGKKYSEAVLDENARLVKKIKKLKKKLKKERSFTCILHDENTGEIYLARETGQFFES
jgi:hypothetical protein